MLSSINIEELLVRLAAEDDDEPDEDSEEKAEDSEESEDPGDSEEATDAEDSPDDLFGEEDLGDMPDLPTDTATEDNLIPGNEEEFEKVLPETLWSLTESGSGYIRFEKIDSKSDEDSARGHYSAQNILDIGKADVSINDYVNSFLLANKMDTRAKKHETGRDKFGPTTTDIYGNGAVTILYRWNKGRLGAEFKWDANDKAIVVPAQFKIEPDLPDSLKPEDEFSAEPEEEIPGLGEIEGLDSGEDDLFAPPDEEENPEEESDKEEEKPEDESEEEEPKEEEASINKAINRLVKIANIFDKAGLYTCANKIDRTIKRLAAEDDPFADLAEDDPPDLPEEDSVDSEDDTPIEDRVTLANEAIDSGSPDAFFEEVVTPALSARKLTNDHFGQLKTFSESGDTTSFNNLVNHLAKSLTSYVKDLISETNPSLANQMTEEELAKIATIRLSAIAKIRGGDLAEGTEDAETDSGSPDIQNLQNAIIEEFARRKGMTPGTIDINKLFEEVVRDVRKNFDIDFGNEEKASILETKKEIINSLQLSNNSNAAQDIRN